MAGYYHFANPEMFAKAMPSCIPEKSLLIYLTGICEMAGGIGLIVGKTRTLAAKCLAIFLLVVFPVNINMAINNQLFPSFPVVLLWLRLPLQFVLIAAILWSANVMPRLKWESSRLS